MPTARKPPIAARRFSTPYGSRVRLAALSVALLLGVIAPGSAQPAADGAPGAEATALRQRVAALELELRALRLQLSEAQQTAPSATARRASSEEAAVADDGAAAPAPTVEERLEALDQQIRILGRQAELEREQAAEAARRAPIVDAGRNGFGLRSADGAFNFRLRGLVQVDSRFFLDDERSTAADTFLARRVRPMVQGTLFKQVEFRFTPDFGSGATVIQDAYADVTFSPAARLRGGKFKSPFGLERLASASDLMFIERGAPTLVAPNRDLGFMLFGDVLGGTTSYAVGIFNGVPDNGLTDGDDGDGKDGAARIFVQPFRKSQNTAISGLGVGAAATYGIANGTVAAPGLAVYRTTGNLVFFRYRSDASAAGTSVADGERARVSGQGYYYSGRFALLAEQAYSRQRVTRVTATTDVGVNAWQVAGSWVLTGEPASYRAVTPRHNLDPARGYWGAFEVVARYMGWSLDDDVFPVFADPAVSARRVRAWTVGLNWYLSPVLKIVADFEEARFKGGAPAGGDRPTGHDMFTRLQVAF